MTVTEQPVLHTDTASDIEVRIVDTDVHPIPVSVDVLKSYAPKEWVDRIWASGNAVAPVPHFYDTPDSFKTMSMRVDAHPDRGGLPGSDPDYAARQLLVDAGVGIATLEPMCDAQLPGHEHVLKSTYNDWLADVWLDQNNSHGRWRGSISVSAQAPREAASEIRRWAGHPYYAQVLMTPQTRGIPFGSPHFDPIYEAASQNGLPVATHLMGQTPFELIPIYPVGNPAHWHDFFASWPLLYVSHLMSLVFDGAFDRHPDLRIVFVEGGFTWAMPVMWRMDRIWEARKADLPHVRRRPSDYVREHVRFTTQPIEEVDAGTLREYIEMMNLGDNLMFSTDYPHWSYDSPSWAIKRFPKDQRDRIMWGNATDLYGLPRTVKALPGEGATADDSAGRGSHGR
jgi:predicted TIM-barrel fold metal-dependent hydrolase